MNPNLKYQSTGDNDSIEDVLIAINNVRTIDGKIVHSKAVWDALERAWKASRVPFGVTIYE